MRIEFSCISDKGLCREVNQDAIFAKADGIMALMVIADGMGGHSYGEKASEIIIGEIDRCWRTFQNRENHQFEKLVGEIVLYLEHANQLIYEEFNKESICGATVVLLFIYGENYCTISSGDSRIYFQKGFEFKQMTQDDVWENQPEVVCTYKKQEIVKHASRGKLISAVGIKPSLSLNIRTDTWTRRNRFLLCSDGLYKMCDNKKIKKILNSYKGGENGEMILKKALKLVYENGARDNVSVILVICNEK